MSRNADSKPRTGSVRVLVADQNLMNCQLLIGALRRCRRIQVVARATSSDRVLVEVRNPSAERGVDWCQPSGWFPQRIWGGTQVAPRRIPRSGPFFSSTPQTGLGWRSMLFVRGPKESSSAETTHWARSAGASKPCTWGKPGRAASRAVGTVLEAFARVAPPVMPDKIRFPRREREVAELVAEGFSNREISAQLGLSQHTIKNYLFHIYEKLGMSSRVDLVLCTCVPSTDPPPMNRTNSESLIKLVHIFTSSMDEDGRSWHRAEHLRSV